MRKLRKALITKIICVLIYTMFYNVNALYSSPVKKDSLRVPMQTDKRKNKYLAIVSHEKATEKTEALIFNVQNLLDHQKAKEITEQQRALDYHIETLKIELGKLIFDKTGTINIKECVENINLSFEAAEEILKNIKNIVANLGETSLNTEDMDKGIKRYHEILSEFKKSYDAISQTYYAAQWVADTAKLQSQLFSSKRWRQIRPIPKWAEDINSQSPIKDILRKVFKQIRAKLKSL